LSFLDLEEIDQLVIVTVKKNHSTLKGATSSANSRVKKGCTRSEVQKESDQQCYKFEKMSEFQVKRWHERGLSNYRSQFEIKSVKLGHP
jgi:hypothetical protein